MTKLLSVEEIAGKIGISKRTVYKLIQTENFPAIKIGRRYFATDGEIDDWVKAKTIEQTRKRSI